MIVMLTVAIAMVRNNICFLLVKAICKGPINTLYLVVSGMIVYRIRLSTISVRFPKLGTIKAIFTVSVVTIYRPEEKSILTVSHKKIRWSRVLRGLLFYKTYTRHDCLNARWLCRIGASICTSRWWCRPHIRNFGGRQSTWCWLTEGCAFSQKTCVSN